MKIGVIDSGLGGYFLYRDLVKKLPCHQYYFIGDNKYCPYGTKSKEIIFERTFKMITFLLNKKVDILVIACNTIATTILDSLKKVFNIPIYNISFYNMEVIKKNLNQKSAVIATDNTINSNFYQNRISGGIFIKASELVLLIENAEIMEIESYLNNLKIQYNLDSYNILLGCTHFLGIEEIIKNTFSSSTIINGNQLLIEDLKLLKTSVLSQKVYTTGSKKMFKKSICKITNFKKIKIKKIKI